MVYSVGFSLTLKTTDLVNGLSVRSQEKKWECESVQAATWVCMCVYAW